METETTQNRTARLWYPIAKSVAIVSGVFVLLLSFLIIVNYLQVQTVDLHRLHAMVAGLLGTQAGELRHRPGSRRVELLQFIEDLFNDLLAVEGRETTQKAVSIELLDLLG